MKCPFFAMATAFLSACGMDVNLGGSSDAGMVDATSDVAVFASRCEPCEAVEECGPAATCGQFAGDTFCASLCTSDAGCLASEACRTVSTEVGDAVSACLPATGMCTPAGPPSAAGDAPLDRCDSLVAPARPATCHSCGRFSDDCQENGCYGGWWCNTSTNKCQRPPKTCG